MSRFVQFKEFGGPDVLRVVEVDPPRAGPGQLRVRVQVAGLNPVDWKIFGSPAAAKMFGAVLPSGNGNDYAGVVDEVGAGVSGFSVGDEVFGGRRFLAQADYVVVPAESALRKPEGLDIEQAGSLDIAGRTACASVRSLALTKDDVVLVSAAAGGVGLLAAQLALRAGARVIGTAGPDNHAFLADLGVKPIDYGDGLVARLEPEGITAVLDNNGIPTLEAALALGIPARRINTIVSHDFAAQHGIGTVGGAAGQPAELLQLAELIASGEVRLPIDSTYPLERVVEAYRRLMAGHLRGKIALVS